MADFKLLEARITERALAELTTRKEQGIKDALKVLGLSPSHMKISINRILTSQGYAPRETDAFFYLEDMLRNIGAQMFDNARSEFVAAAHGDFLQKVEELEGQIEELRSITQEQ